MTFQQELSSWMFPENLSLSPAPEVGAKAPSTDQLPMPPSDGKSSVVTFLRHCGCPFAEKAFRRMRSAAESRPNVKFIAVSHSDKPSTDRWLESVGGAGNVQVIVDDKRTLYAQWGLGVSSLLHVLSPSSMWNVYKMARDEKIANRPTESGSRWQTSGTWAVDGNGTVKSGGPAVRADDVPDVDAAVQSLDS